MSNNELSVISNSKISFSINSINNLLVMMDIKSGRIAADQYYEPAASFEAIPLYIGLTTIALVNPIIDFRFYLENQN